MMETYFLFFLLGIFFFCSYRLVKTTIQNKKIFQMISNFESYNAVLYFIMEKAYQITFKDKMLVFSVEGLKVSDKEFEIYTKEFTSLVLKMMGPNLRKEFVYLFGDEETFLFNIVDFFNVKYENDEIRKTQQEKLMTSEGNT